jgi:hypothetical protein
LHGELQEKVVSAGIPEIWDARNFLFIADRIPARNPYLKAFTELWRGGDTSTLPAEESGRWRVGR